MISRKRAFVTWCACGGTNGRRCERCAGLCRIASFGCFGPIPNLLGGSDRQDGEAHTANRSRRIHPDEFANGFELMGHSQENGEAYQSTLLHRGDRMKAQSRTGDIGDHTAVIVWLEVDVRRLA